MPWTPEPRSLDVDVRRRAMSMTESTTSMYEVLPGRYQWVNVRAGPLMNAVMLGRKQRGELVAVDRRGGSDNNWVRTVETFGDQAGWLLVDGTESGLGVLLRLAPLWPLPPIASDGDGHAFDLQSPAEYTVVHTLVKVRREPAVTATSLGFGLRKGATVSVDAVCGAWVHLATSTGSRAAGAPTHQTTDPAAYAGGWVLTDGAALASAGCCRR